MSVNNIKAIGGIILILLLISCNGANDRKTGNDFFILDMVHNNPAEGITKTSFNDPKKLKDYGYTGMVLNDFKFAHATISYDSFDSTIFPKGSEERKWIDDAAEALGKRIDECHEAGIKAYAFIDIIVLPKKLVEKYKNELLDENGKINLSLPLTEKIHRIMLREIFDQYPYLDGLVIRTGETYLHNVPYHTGNNPIIAGPSDHIKLIEILRDEVCEKLDKQVFYRTWDFGFFHTEPEYYLAVTEKVEPHPNLVFSIKHTEGDYHRTFPFNPTLGIGKHRQIVEVQCQREYEGKGAHPNYVMDGVIDGFEEYDENKGINSLEDLKKSPLFAGVWSWSRGGGWVGPYIKNELWCDLNAFVISAWGRDTSKSEEEIFNEYSAKLDLSPEDQEKFRRLNLLSAKGVLRGHNSLVKNVNVWWTRDQFLGGIDLLDTSFMSIIDEGLTAEVLDEKQECVNIWREIVELSDQIHVNDPELDSYLKVSSEYGLIKYSIIQQAWIIMLKGLEGDVNGGYDQQAISTAIDEYDRLWQDFEKLEKNNPQCASLYKPYSFVFEPPDFHEEKGMDMSVDRYREKIAKY